MAQIKTLKLKLGGECNLGCTHCHCEKSFYEFNPDILPWIRSQNFDRIEYGGGEPLLYWDLICGISNQLGRKYSHYFVTNGTLLTPEIVNYINSNPNIHLSISFDGYKGNRDTSIPVDWSLVNQLRNFGICSCYFKGNTLSDIQNDLNLLEQTNFVTSGKFNNHSVAFPHQTVFSPNDDITLNEVSLYIKEYKQKLAEAIISYKYGLKLENNHILKQALKDWYIPKDYSFGCKCFNDYKQYLTIDGRFMLCPYGHEYIGDIYSGIDKEKLNKYIPERCKSCSYWEICRNTCIANITEHECIIFKEMHEFMKSCFTKLNLEEQVKKDYEDLIIL